MFKRNIKLQTIYKLNSKSFIRIPTKLDQQSKGSLLKQNLNSRLFDYQLKTSKLVKDEIHLNQINLGSKSASKKSYLIFKATEPIAIIILKQLAIFLLFSLSTYYIFRNKIYQLLNKKLKPTNRLLRYICIFSSSLTLIFILKNPKMKITRIIRQIELDNSLSTVKYNIYLSNKTFNAKISDFYIYNPTIQKILKNKILFDDLVIGINGTSYSIPLSKAIIPDDDLFLTSVYGYNLGILPKKA